MSTYAGKDNCTDTILDFIAGGVPGNKVGEAMGNYNAVIGNARSTDDLSKRTVREVIQIGQQRRSNGMPSTAMGRYQFLKATLEGLLEGVGYSDDTLFTPAVQDRLAVQLLRGRGYSRWWKNKISDQDFAHNLSLEWASLPDPENGGKSHYDGDSAGNHASTSLDNVYAMLRRARAAMPAQQPDVPDIIPPDEDSAVERVKAIQTILSQAEVFSGEITGTVDKATRAGITKLAAAARKEVKAAHRKAAR